MKLKTILFSLTTLLCVFVIIKSFGFISNDELASIREKLRHSQF